MSAASPAPLTDERGCDSRLSLTSSGENDDSVDSPVYGVGWVGITVSQVLTSEIPLQDVGGEVCLCGTVTPGEDAAVSGTRWRLSEGNDRPFFPACKGAGYLLTPQTTILHWKEERIGTTTQLSESAQIIPMLSAWDDGYCSLYERIYTPNGYAIFWLSISFAKINQYFCNECCFELCKRNDEKTT